MTYQEIVAEQAVLAQQAQEFEIKHKEMSDRSQELSKMRSDEAAKHEDMNVSMDVGNGTWLHINLDFKSLDTDVFTLRNLIGDEGISFDVATYNQMSAALSGYTDAVFSFMNAVEDSKQEPVVIETADDVVNTINGGEV